MKFNISKELKIGFFIIAVLAVTFFVINFLRGEDVFNTEYEVSSFYENVQGLLPSNPVYIRGFKAGSVVGVTYDYEKGGFDVTCSIKKDFPVPSDSRMVIHSVDIMGGKGIRIDEGTSAEMAQDGAFLTPEVESDMVASLTGSLGPLIGKVVKTLDSLEVTISSVNDMLNAENRNSFSRSLRHMERTLANANEISASINGKSEELEAFIDNLESLSKSLNGVATKADTLITDISGISSKVNMDEINATIASFHSLMDKVQDPDGSLGKLIHDGSVYNSVDSLLFDVDNLIKKIQENPKKYIRISVF